MTHTDLNQDDLDPPHKFEGDQFKKAFKIKLRKGCKFTTIIKKRLKNDLNCIYQPIYESYVCPIDSKEQVENFLKSYNINAELIDCLDLREGKSKKVTSIENKIYHLEKEVFKEERQLLCDVASYDPSLSIYDLDNFSYSENLRTSESSDRKSIRHQIENDLRIRNLDLQGKKNEIENLRISLKNYEKEDVDTSKIIECLQKNEIGDAELFVSMFSQKYLFDPSEGKSGTFYMWNGTNWEFDKHKQRYFDFDKLSSTYFDLSFDEMLEDKIRKDLLKRSKELRTAQRRRNVFGTVEVYLSFKGIWDQCVGFLPCLNGVVDLKTGKLLPHSPDRFIRMLCPTKFVAEARSVLFDQFIDDITLGNNELKSFLSCALGSGLVGDAREEKVYLLHGTDGRNGKGTLMQAAERVLGPYAKTFRSEMLLFNKHPTNSSSPNPDLVALQSVRFAIFSEVNKDSKLDASKIKNLSGRDTISCRNLYSNIDKEIKPTHTMFIQTNFLPEAPAYDNAFWKRIVVIPFDAEFVEKPVYSNQRTLNPQFKELLFLERESILAWLIKGCLKYQSTGLILPSIVAEKINTYREDNDHISKFLKEMCIEGSEFSTRKKAMQRAIKGYCNANKLKAPSRDEIYNRLKQKYQQHRSNSGGCWIGIKIEEHETDW